MVNFKIYTYEQLQQDKEKYEEVFAYLKMYGSHCMAYSILQPKMNYFIIDGIGIVAYAKLGKRGKTRFVLSDPLVSRQYTEYLLGEFLRVFPKSCFLQISEKIANILNKKFGFYMTLFGTETYIFKSDFNTNTNLKIIQLNDAEIRTVLEQLKYLETKKDKLYENSLDDEARKEFWQVKRKVQKLRKKYSELLKKSKSLKELSFLDIFLDREEMKFLRREVSLAEKEGLFIEELTAGKVSNEVLKEISNEWIQDNTLSKTEMSYLTKPFDISNMFDNGKRVFIIYDPNKIYGFTELSPIFQDEQIIGYYIDIIRTLREHPAGTINYLILKVIDKVFSENYQIITLGLAPFNRIKSIIDKNKRADNILTTKIFQMLFNYGNFLYDAKGQAFHKEKYNARNNPVYYCSKKKIQLNEIIDGFKLCGLNPLKLL